MEKKQNRGLQKFKERLKNTYRFVIMNDETFEEITSYRLTLLNVYILLSTVIVLTATIVISIIVFTPVKRYIPGYGTANANTTLMRMDKQIKEMERELELQRKYTENFRKILVGDVETIQQEEPENIEFPDSLIKVERIREDEQLRREVKLQEISASQNEEKSNGIFEVSLDQLYFTTPVSGEISAAFLPEKNHFGVDVLAPKNSVIKAVLDGIIIQSDWTLETGNTIGIQHSNNLISFYKHNSVLLKKVGEYVKAGEAIAIIGNTGELSDGPHLHFELWHLRKPLDPTDYILF